MSLPRNYEKELLGLLTRLRAEQSELNLITAEAHAWDTRYEPAKALYQDYRAAKIKVDALYDQYRSLDERLRPESEAINKAIVEARSKIQGTQTEMLDIFIESIARPSL